MQAQCDATVPAFRGQSQDLPGRVVRHVDFPEHFETDQDRGCIGVHGGQGGGEPLHGHRYRHDHRSRDPVVDEKWEVARTHRQVSGEPGRLARRRRARGKHHLAGARRDSQLVDEGPRADGERDQPGARGLEVRRQRLIHHATRPQSPGRHPDPQAGPPGTFGQCHPGSDLVRRRIVILAGVAEASRDRGEHAEQPQRVGADRGEQVRQTRDLGVKYGIKLLVGLLGDLAIGDDAGPVD